MHLKGVAGVGPVPSRHPKYAVGNRNSQGFLVCLMSGGKIPCRRGKTLRVGSHFSFAQLTASIGLIPGCCSCMSGSIGRRVWGAATVLTGSRLAGLPRPQGCRLLRHLGHPQECRPGSFAFCHCCTSEIGKTKSSVHTPGGVFRLRSSSSCLSRCGASNLSSQRWEVTGVSIS